MKLSILVLTAIIVSSCNKEKISPEIKINFINETQRDIHNVSVDGINLRTINKGKETGMIKFDEFGTDSGFPDCDFISIYQNDTILSTSVLMWCGTQKTRLKPDNYQISIQLDTIRFDSVKTKEYFRLEFK